MWHAKKKKKIGNYETRGAVTDDWSDITYLVFTNQCE